LKLPDGRVAVRMDYVQALEETPAFTLFKLFVRQFLYVACYARRISAAHFLFHSGFQLYLMYVFLAEWKDCVGADAGDMTVTIERVIPDILE
jgi:hypothetical protein